MDTYIQNLMCTKTVVASDGSTSKHFSLDVFLPNAVCFAGGFCLAWFLVAEKIPGVVPKK